MNANNLLASVALFSELYNSEKYSNITDIIAEFIKGVVVTENKWSTTPTEMTSLLEKVYGLKIPEAVVRSTIRNRLNDVCKNASGIFHFDKKISEDFKSLDKEYITLKEIHNDILGYLLEFIKKRSNTEINEKEKVIIEDNFQKFLMDNGISEKYTDVISAFIIKNSVDTLFRKNLNLVREGIILYQGIKYSSDLNTFGVWNTDLTILLSPEHLFNALGYNGILFNDLFTDFYKLVTEINQSNKNRGSDKRIKLRYFKESADEIDSMFRIAEEIKGGRAQLTSHRPAMKEILNDCKNPSDIVAKKIRFYQDLKLMGIVLQDFDDSILYKYRDYNVEDLSVIKMVEKESIEKIGSFDEQSCHQMFRLFTKVNYFRGGQSRDKFENIGHIYITENGLALFLAHNNKVKFEEKDIPFAKNLDYLTNKFWFKLKKGLGANNDFPKSFDIVTKAQIILASHTNNFISKHYETLKKDLREGRLNQESALELNHHLRERTSMPEEITYDTIDKSLDFLSSDNLFQEYILEKETKDRLLLDTQKHVHELKSQLEKRDEEKKQQELAQIQARVVLERKEYCNGRWIDQKMKNNWDLGYFLLAAFLTVVPFTIGFYLKIYKDLEQPTAQWGKTQFFFIVFFIGWYWLELMCRSYLLNKERVKRGFLWMCVVISRIGFQKMKSSMYTEFENDFDQSIAVQ